MFIELSSLQLSRGGLLASSRPTGSRVVDLKVETSLLKRSTVQHSLAHVPRPLVWERPGYEAK